jgi:hypothetical protein
MVAVILVRGNELAEAAMSMVSRNLFEEVFLRVIEGMSRTIRLA